MSESDKKWFESLSPDQKEQVKKDLWRKGLIGLAALGLGGLAGGAGGFALAKKLKLGPTATGRLGGGAAGAGAFAAGVGTAHGMAARSRKKHPDIYRKE
jgi:hypothetical protein